MLFENYNIVESSGLIIFHNANIKNKQIFALVVAFFFPFIGLFYTLYHWRAKWAKNVFWLLCVYMGAVHVYWPEGAILGMGSDGERYFLMLISWHQLNYSFKTIFQNYLVDQNTMDLYQQLITCTVSKFTDNGHVLFSIFAFVFGFFYSRNIWYILEKMPKVIPKKYFILITLYFLVSPIYHINGVRMWTALHVYVYALMPFLLENKKNKLWMLLFTPFIHFSYLYVMCLAAIYAFCPFKLKMKNNFFYLFALIFFIVTLFITSINLNVVSELLTEYSPDAYSTRIGSYANQNILERNIQRQSLNNWYVAGSFNIKYWCYSILIITIIYFSSIEIKYRYRHLCLFILLLGGISNLMSLIPSGARFIYLTQMFIIPFILLVSFQIDNYLFKKIINIMLLMLVIPFVVDIRRLFDMYSITLLFGNFITVSFWENNVPLITYVKMMVL